MMFASTFLVLLPASTFALPLPLTRSRMLLERRSLDLLQQRQGSSIDESLVPEFGVQANVDPDGSGNCKGINGAAIPCNCPPDRATFLSDLQQNVAAGTAVNNSDVTGIVFPSGDDVDSALARFNAATVTLQNLEGPGVGCPQVATTWAAQIAAIQATGSASSPEAKAAITAGVTQGPTTTTDTAGAAAAAPAPAPATDSGASTGSIDASLVPEFGIEAGQSPDGSGNCAGLNGAAIPCQCPPDRATFISDLAENVAAGFAVNNTAVTGITFPTGSDKASVLARLNAATVTLQNLEGAGVGCPQAATTFGSQVEAANALPA